MSIRNLEYLMNPSSVALLGASEKPFTVGEVLTRNLLCAGYSGEVFLINPNYETITGQKTYPDVSSLPKTVDLAVVATPPETVPGLVAELGRARAKAAIVITAGFGEEIDDRGGRSYSSILDAAGPHLLRIVGPNCLGIMVPGIGLNASMAHIFRPIPGNIAFVAQSGAVQTAVLDWATSRGIGFSHFISLGDMADVDFGDTLDYLARDFSTRAILLYMETVRNARKFMSAARAAARVKPVIVLKAGRYKEGALAAARHTGAIAGDDGVYDAAFRRAGMLRVYQIQELFDAVETLAMMDRPIAGDRLAIVTNGGGVGVISTDALIERGGRLASLAPEIIRRLDEALPPGWSHSNPIDLMGDAAADRYAAALDIALESTDIDGVLVLFCPIASISGVEVADAVIRIFRQKSHRPRSPVLLTCWLGEEAALEPRRLFARHKIPTYKTPTNAVNAFMHMVRYRRSQEMLMETPPSIPEAFSADIEEALRVVGNALAEDREWLTEPEARAIMEAYGISPARSREETAPPDSAAVHRPLMISMSDDPQFGPVITFGHGGQYAEEFRDRAVALPPLNMHLARQIISQTRISRLLQARRASSPDSLDEIALALVKVSQLVCDISEIAELEINPILTDAYGLVALDVRIRVSRSPISASERLAIRPYPKELEDLVSFSDGRILKIRPIRPEDEPGFVSIVDSLTPEERRMRFLHPVHALSHHQAAWLTQIDYDREMALVLTSANSSAPPGQELFGSVRIIADPDNERAEYAILVHKNAAGKGLGRLLMRRIIDYSRSRGIKEIFGQVLCENIPMLKVCESLGFVSKRDPDDPSLVIVSLRL